MIFIATLTIIILLSVPRLSNIDYTPDVTASQNVIEVMFESEAAFWIAEASISVNGCDSNVIVVQGKTCSSLPTTERSGGGYDILVPLSPVYFLEKSRMNLSDIESDVNPNIWVLNKRDYLEIKNGVDTKEFETCDALHECPRHPGDSCCYHTQEYAGGSILHQITKSDFYFAIPWPSSGTHTFDVSYTAVVYDLDAIVHLPGTEVFPRSAKISDWFKFHSMKCILLNATCPVNTSRFFRIVVSIISRRMDILVLALILEFVVSIVGAGMVLLCKLTLLKSRWCHAKRSSTTFEELEPSDATALIESNSNPERVYNVTISTSTFRSTKST